MVRTIKARFANGVFKPLDPVVGEGVQEGQEVLITISTVVSSGDPLHDTAGAWAGLVDTDALKRNIAADRLLSTRPPALL